MNSISVNLSLSNGGREKEKAEEKSKSFFFFWTLSSSIFSCLGMNERLSPLSLLFLIILSNELLRQE